MPETKKRTRCPNGTRKNPKTKKCEAKKRKSTSSKKSVKSVKKSKYQSVEEWIIKKWPHKSLSIPEHLVSNLAGAAVDRKSSLDDFKKQLLQNVKNSKTKTEKDEKKIIQFFETLKTKF
jgi:hypothetical protein